MEDNSLFDPGLCIALCMFVLERRECPFQPSGCSRTDLNQIEHCKQGTTCSLEGTADRTRRTSQRMGSLRCVDGGIDPFVRPEATRPIEVLIERHTAGQQGWVFGIIELQCSVSVGQREGREIASPKLHPLVDQSKAQETDGRAV